MVRITIPIRNITAKGLDPNNPYDRIRAVRALKKEGVLNPDAEMITRVVENARDGKYL